MDYLTKKEELTPEEITAITLLLTMEEEESKSVCRNWNRHRKACGKRPFNRVKLLDDISPKRKYGGNDWFDILEGENLLGILGF